MLVKDVVQLKQANTAYQKTIESHSAKITKLKQELKNQKTAANEIYALNVKLGLSNQSYKAANTKATNTVQGIKGQLIGQIKAIDVANDKLKSLNPFKHANNLREALVAKLGKLKGNAKFVGTSVLVVSLLIGSGIAVAVPQLPLHQTQLVLSQLPQNSL